MAETWHPGRISRARRMPENMTSWTDQPSRKSETKHDVWPRLVDCLSTNSAEAPLHSQIWRPGRTSWAGNLKQTKQFNMTSDDFLVACCCVLLLIVGYCCFFLLVACLLLACLVDAAVDKLRRGHLQRENRIFVLKISYHTSCNDINAFDDSCWIL